MVGKTIAHYSVLEKLGAGGMGEVYRAHDTRLGRDVALKVLPEAFTTDRDRLARFEREAHLLAALNHPNIAAIHGLEEADGLHCLVLELVEGETLAERLARGAVPLEEALQTCRQIAEALEAAHERGVIHRDLKPGNVKVTPQGTVKLLDFGLAKALEGESEAADVSKSPTMSAAATQAGIMLGTAAYMSPEQARGRPADRRADIWAFGCVLYELLTGRKVFEGETVSDTLASVLKTELDWNALPAAAPAALRRLLRRCLERDPRRRLRDIGEARILIEDTLAGRADEPAAVAAALRPTLTRRQQLVLLAGLIGVAAAAAVLTRTLQPAAPEPPLRKFELAVATQGLSSPAISPDGQKIAYISGNRLWIRDLDRLEPRAFPSTEGALHPFWSPDSATVGYLAAGKIWKVPTSGGESAILADAGGGFTGGAGATWGPDGTIVLSRGHTGLLQLSARGGDLRPLLELDPKTESDIHNPYLLPGGRGVLFVLHRLEGGPETLTLLAGATRKVLLQLPGQAIWNPRYSPTGHILYRRTPSNPGIWALPFSLSSLEVSGEPFLAVPGGISPSVSSDGTLVYVQGGESVPTQLVWVNRSGQPERHIGQPQEQAPIPALSPDGRRVAVMANEGGNSDIWIHDVARGTKTRLTFAPGFDRWPAWSPTGDQVFFSTGDSPANSTVAVKAADGTGEVQTLAKGTLPAVSRDGKYLVYSVVSQGGRWELWYLPLQGDRKPVPFLQGPADAWWGQVSPDGRHIAYVSEESGRAEIYLKRFPGGEGKWQVSVNGGDWPRWSRAGDKLFYVQGDDLMEVEVETRPSLTLSTPRKLFTREPSGATVGYGFPEAFDVTPDGRRFVLVQRAEPEKDSADRPGITVVENWFAEFRPKP